MKRAVLLALTVALSCAQAEPVATPHERIARLGVQIRQILEAAEPASTPDDAERAVADEITAFARSTPGNASLTQPDRQGRTPLMQAVSGGYLLVVKALLADASVRQQINAADTAGETAWMLAQFAPGMTLVACQPGALTLERYPLLPPYLRRMATLMAAKKSVVVAISQALQEAGADVDPDAARKAWLARCPNTAPELRQALANSDLLNTLVSDALDRQMSFNKTSRSGLATIPQKPPQDMRFVVTGGHRLNAGDLNCRRKPPPLLRGALNWSGIVRFKGVIATRAGVVEAVDIDVPPGQDAPPVVFDHFRGAVIRALAGYQCEGDHVFEQEFQFKVE